MNKIEKERGFTMMEATMVCLIIVLIVGGVFVAKDLIRAAKVRNIIVEIKQTNTAVNVFMDKYEYIPGDIPAAEKYGLVPAGSNCNDENGDGMPESAEGPAPNDLGCGGNGNGILQDAPVNNGRVNFAWELRNFWYHLSTKKYLDEAYDGTNEVGKGFPETALPGIGIHVSGDTSLNGKTGGNFYTVGAVDPTEENGLRLLTFDNALEPQDAYNIDGKVDDGLPEKGVAVARGGINSQNGGSSTAVAGDPGCKESSTPTPQYNVQFSIPACQIRIRMGR